MIRSSILPAIAAATLFTAQSADAAAPLYGAPASYPNGFEGGGESHATVTTADFDGDAIPDLAYADSAGKAVRVWLGTSTGAFTAPAVYPSGGDEPEGLAHADFDGDGDEDLVVANVASGNVAVLANSGAGTFAVAGTYGTPGVQPGKVLVGDYDEDGRPDVAAKSMAAYDAVTIWLGDGNGGLTAGQAATVPGAFITSLAAGDLNGDGHTDLVAGDAFTGFTPLLGDGDGGFAAGAPVQTDVEGHEDLAIADVTGDGAADVVMPGVWQNKLIAYPGNGDGSFGTAITSAVNPSFPGLPPTFLVAVTLADVDGDPNGALDAFLSGGTDQTVYVMHGNGDGTFTFIEKHNVGGVARTLITDDLNGDVKPDLLAGVTGAVKAQLHN